MSKRGRVVSLDEIDLSSRPDREITVADLVEGQGVKKQGFIESLATDIAQQTVGGVEDIANILNYPFDAAADALGLSRIHFTKDGAKSLTPEEAQRARSQGDIGLIPGQGAQPQPTSFVGKATRLASQSAVAAPIAAATFGLVSPSTVTGGNAVVRATRVIRNAVSNSAKSFSAAPVAATQVEAGFGALAGAGGAIAKNINPESEYSELVGELAGPTAFSLTPTNIMIKVAGGVKSLYRKIRHPFRKEQGRPRAEARVQKTGSPEERARGARKSERKQIAIDPKTDKSVLNPADRSEVPGALELQESIIQSSQELRDKSNVDISNANKVIRASLESAIEGKVGDPAIAIKEGTDYVTSLLEVRVSIAALRVKERIEGLGIDMTDNQLRKNLNLVAQEELAEKALKASNDQQQELFNAVDPLTPTPFSAAEAKYNEMLDSLGGATKSDMPAEATAALSKSSSGYLGKHKGIPSEMRREDPVTLRLKKSFNEPIKPGTLEPYETTLLEMRELEKKLRQTADNATKGTGDRNKNKARIAGAIRKVIRDEDLTNVRTGSEEEAVKLLIARGYSRNAHDVWGQPALRKVLATNAEGIEVIRSGVLLEKTIGIADTDAREGLQALFDVFAIPKPATGTIPQPSVERLRETAEDYVKMRFLSKTVTTGEFSALAGEKFLRDNKELLSLIPDVEQQLRGVIDAGDTLAMKLNAKGLFLDDLKASKANVLIQKDALETFRQIKRMNPGQQFRESKELLRLVRFDKTGEAELGLKKALVEHFMSTAREKAVDTTGEYFTSGFALQKTINESKAMIRGLDLSFAEIKRLKTRTNDLILLEKRRQAKPSPEGIIGGAVHRVYDILASMIGVRVASVIRKGTAGPGSLAVPQQITNTLKQMARAGILDPAGRILRDEIFDDAMFVELMNSKVIGGELTKEASHRLRVYLGIALADYGGAFDEEITEQ